MSALKQIVAYRRKPGKMKDENKTKQQLIDELVEMRRRITELETSEAQRKQVGQELRESEAKYSTLVEQSTDAVLITQDGVFQFVNKAVEEVYGYTVEQMTGMSFLGTLAPECRDLVVQRYESRVAGREVPPVYEAKIQCKDGTTKEVEISGRLIQYQGRPAVMAIVHDITHRKIAEEKILRRSRELAAMHTVLMSITQTLDLEQVLKEIVSQVGAAVESVYTRIVTVNQNGSLGIGSEDFAGITPVPDGPWPRGVTDRIIASGEPIIVDDVDAPGDSGPFHLAAGIKSFAGMPIRTKDATIGVLLVHSAKRNAFAGSMELLVAFANQAAIAIENAQLYDTVRSERLHVQQLLGQVLTAQEDERRRLSLDLHDTITQSMYGVLAHIGAADELLSRSNPVKLQAELVHAKKALDQTLADLRRVAVGLHPPSLGNCGLAQALHEHINDFTRNNKDIECSFRVKGEPQRLPSNVEIDTYRIAQEALNNVRKHSAATKVVVLLQFLPGGISLQVSDNGKGFDFDGGITAKVTDGHLGLAGMVERVEMLGGTLRVKTGPGRGTKVMMSFSGPATEVE